jgi:hypothetical protein
MKVHNKYAGTAPANAVYVGRGSPWGNPFRISEYQDRDEVCDRFEQEVLPKLDLTLLRGKHLVCFCAPLRCHADALLREANK